MVVDVEFPVCVDGDKSDETDAADSERRLPQQVNPCVMP